MGAVIGNGTKLGWTKNIKRIKRAIAERRGIAVVSDCSRQRIGSIQAKVLVQTTPVRNVQAIVARPANRSLQINTAQDWLPSGGESGIQRPRGNLVS